MLAFSQHEDRTPTHGYEVSREARNGRVCQELAEGFLSIGAVLTATISCATSNHLNVLLAEAERLYGPRDATYRFAGVRFDPISGCLLHGMRSGSNFPLNHDLPGSSPASART
jgi:hypothetical protein